MAIKYIDWRNDKSFPYKGTVQDIYEGMEFNNPDDDFAVFQNTDNGKYAVYYELHEGGWIISLIEDFTNLMCMSFHATDGFDQKIDRLFQQHALDYGFPEQHPPIRKGLTWRKLANAINKLPEEFLDTTAYVFRRDGGGTLATVRYIEPWCYRYDGTIPGPGGEEDNCFCIYSSYDDEED